MSVSPIFCDPRTGSENPLEVFFASAIFIKHTSHTLPQREAQIEFGTGEKANIVSFVSDVCTSPALVVGWDALPWVSEMIAESVDQLGNIVSW